VERVELQRDGVRAVKAAAGGFALQKLRFPARHRLRWFEPELGYIALVMDGAMQKRFARDSWLLGRDGFATLPMGAGHDTDFGAGPTHVLTISPVSPAATTTFARFLRERRRWTAPAATVLARRIVCELNAPDTSSELAVEGLVLQVVALGQRETATRRERAGWLTVVVDALHEQAPTTPSLTALAATAGVHPAHLARAFRQAFGLTVGDYARRRRLDWAAAQLETDIPLAQLALDAGFADQSHFTRAFRRHTGVTPGRYRALVRR
jgi:AraC family transcriptional regulator